MQLQKFLLFLLTVALIAISDVQSEKGDWQMMFSHNINLKPKQYHISKADSTEAIEKSTTPEESSIENDSKSVMSSSLSTKALILRIAEHYPIGKKNNSNLIHVIIESWIALNMHNRGFRIELVSKEVNHLAAILHVYAGGLMFMK